MSLQGGTLRGRRLFWIFTVILLVIALLVCFEIAIMKTIFWLDQKPA